jgi:hypothetical protein
VLLVASTGGATVFVVSSGRTAAGDEVWPAVRAPFFLLLSVLLKISVVVASVSLTFLSPS